MEKQIRLSFHCLLFPRWPSTRAWQRTFNICDREADSFIVSLPSVSKMAQHSCVAKNAQHLQQKAHWRRSRRHWAGKLTTRSREAVTQVKLARQLAPTAGLRQQWTSDRHRVHYLLIVEPQLTHPATRPPSSVLTRGPSAKLSGLARKHGIRRPR
jgi:hypothetical protein